MKARGPFGWPKGTLPQALGGTGGTDATKAITAARLADRLPVSSTALQRLQQSATAGLLEYTGSDGFKNLVGRNGGLEVWQRGAGGSASIAVSASATAYTADGWALATGANEASTVSQQAGLVSGSRFCARVQRNNAQTGTTAMTFEFPLDTDEIVFMQGKVVSLSLVLRSGANWSPTSGNLTIALYTGTGSAAKRAAGAYTGEATPISVTQAISTTATRYGPGNASFTSAALGASITQASIVITWTPTGTAGAADYFEIDDVQLEISPVATAFERRPFEAELRACQTHYEKSYDYATAPATSTTNGSGAFTSYSTGSFEWITQRYMVRKRAVPTVTVYSTTGASGNVRNITGAADVAASVVSGGETGFGISANLTTANNNRWHFVADAGI